MMTCPETGREMTKLYPTQASLIGGFTIATAIAFNIPYALLASQFDYPAVLRRPAGEVLALFDAGGGQLILTWHAFALAALLFIPLSIALGLRPNRIGQHPALAIGAAVVGSLAGVMQVVGLWRWVFVVPGLAKHYIDPLASEAQRLAAVSAFELINQYGGVAIGEHIGQLLTSMFVVLVSLLQWREKSRVTAGIGLVTAAGIAIGTNEGVAIALGQSGEIFSLFTIVGFLGLTLWLIFTGAIMIRAGGSAEKVK